MTFTPKRIRLVGLLTMFAALLGFHFVTEQRAGLLRHSYHSQECSASEPCASFLKFGLEELRTGKIEAVSQTFQTEDGLYTIKANRIAVPDCKTLWKVWFEVRQSPRFILEEGEEPTACKKS